MYNKWMKSSKYLSIAVLLLLCGCPKKNRVPGSSEIHGNDPYERGIAVPASSQRSKIPADAPNFNISTLVKHHRAGLKFTTNAFVVYKYQCPPCPGDAQCKPCMKNNIVISEKPDLMIGYGGLGSREMILYCDDSAGFKLGKKYRFFIGYENVDFSSDKRTIWSGSLIYHSDLPQ